MSSQHKWIQIIPGRKSNYKPYFHITKCQPCQTEKKTRKTYAISVYIQINLHFKQGNLNLHRSLTCHRGLLKVSEKLCTFELNRITDETSFIQTWHRNTTCSFTYFWFTFKSYCQNMCMFTTVVFWMSLKWVAIVKSVTTGAFSPGSCARFPARPFILSDNWPNSLWP